MIYYIADTHFGHKNIIKYDSRPFETVEEMNETIINRWNARVTADDTVCILGDLSWENKNRIVAILNRLAGRLILILGNHDDPDVYDRIKEHFELITNYLELDDCGTKVVMSHYPMPFWNCDMDKDGDTTDFHLYGHVHNNTEWLMLEKWTSELSGRYRAYSRMANVGCMLPYMDYTPRTLKEIIDAQIDF